MGTGKRTSGDAKNLYQRNGIYYGRATVGGKEYRKSLETSNPAEAKRRRKKWLAEFSPYHGTIRHTFEEAAVLWLNAGQWKQKTLDGYAKLLGPINTYFGAMFWDQVDKTALQSFAEWLRQQALARTVKRSIKPATINRYLTIISGIADHVRELDTWPEINPVSLLPKKPRKEIRHPYIRPPARDIDAYFARMQGTFGDLCRTALLTGARKDELVYLKRTDAENGKMQLWETKSLFRVITTPPAAQVIIDRQKPVEGSEYLFNTANGGPYKRATEMWREVVIRAQNMAQKEGRTLTRMRFHDLRHEYAIRYLENGGSLYTLQDILGHGSIKQTESYLRYLTPEAAAIAKNVVGTNPGT